MLLLSLLFARLSAVGGGAKASAAHRGGDVFQITEGVDGSWGVA